MVIQYRVVGMLPKPINCAKIVIRRLRVAPRSPSGGSAEGKAIACTQVQRQVLEAGGGDDGPRTGGPDVLVREKRTLHLPIARIETGRPPTKTNIVVQLRQIGSVWRNAAMKSGAQG